MAVIFAVVGGGAVVGLATTPVPGDSNYSDHSDYGNYDNYSNYSDAAERRQRRIEAKKNEIRNQKNEVNTYKTQSVNEYLQSSSLKAESGVTVSVAEVKRDGDKKIADEVKMNMDRESADLVCEISEIDAVLCKIDKLLEEGE